MQTVTTRYLPETNSRGARIKVISYHGSKTYSYDYSSPEPHKAAFEEYLKMLNEEMRERYREDGEWFKLVAWAGLPDQRGCAFIIK